MTERKDGGPAFPSTCWAVDSMGEPKPQACFEGVSLRQYYAAKAMQALLCNDRYHGVIGVNLYEHSIAEMSLKMADAMLGQEGK